MIAVHRLNGTEFVLNDDHIEIMESTPDTVITLVNEKKYIVRESTGEIVSMIIDYRRQVNGKYREKE